jgi:hypothetical protein
MSSVTYIDGTYSYYRKLWRTDRWKFSSDMVKLNGKRSRAELTEQEQHTLNTMNRIVDEHDGDWMEGHEIKDRKIQLIKKRQPH